MENTDNMTLQQIRDLAEQAERAAAEPAPETVYTRVVAGKTFTAPSLEALTDLISAAAEEVLAVKPVVPVEEKELTADERFVLAQEFASQPDVAFEKQFFRTTGMSSKHGVPST